MSDEKWYWKGNGVFKKDELIKKMKEDIIHQDDKSPTDNQTSNLIDWEDMFGAKEFFDYCDSIFKKEKKNERNI